MDYAFIDEQRVTILAYDISIADIEERKKRAIEFKTLKLAEQKLGVGQHVLKSALKNRGRVYSTLFEREYAIRYKSLNK